MDRELIRRQLDAGWGHFKAGRFAEAAALCGQALQADPEHGDAWYILGTCHFRLNRAAEAESALRKAIVARPDLADAHAILGMTLASQGRVAEAVGPFQRAASLDPTRSDAHNNLGSALRDLGRLVEAEASFRQAVRLRPDHPMALASLLHLLATEGRHLEEADLLREVICLRPDHLGARLHLGSLLTRDQRFDEALACFLAAVSLAPDSAVAHNGLGVALAGLKRFDEALKSYDRALALRPDEAEVHINRGASLGAMGREDEALACFDRAIHLAPDRPDAHANRGVPLMRLGRFEEALASIDRALHLAPDHADAHTNRSIIRLLHGDYGRGWPEHEWRSRIPAFKLPRFPQPPWQGEPLGGGTILLHAEQGLGDTLQFIRYARMVKQRVGRVVVQCQRPLVRLLETCDGIDQIVPRGDPLPAFDVHAPLMSLPTLFRTTLETIPAPIPYLAADPVRVARWRERLEPIEGLRVGIAWQGNPEHPRDRDRSFALAWFEELAGIDGVRLISLQKGYGVAQLRELSGRFPVMDLGEEVDPGLKMMEDTPALLRNLDLVISPDTAIVHLAGALGVPVWIGVTFVPDFRWLLGRGDSPWYPTARIFRQGRRGRWEDVFERMAGSLAAMAAARGGETAARGG